MPPDSYLIKWSELMTEAGERFGRPLCPAFEYKSFLEQAGFESVVEVRHSWPSNPWPRDRKYKELGTWSLANIGGNLEGLTIALFTRGLGWDHERTLDFCARVRKDLRDRKIHAYWAM